MDDWTTTVQAVKHAVWGSPCEPEPEMYYDKFSPVTGDVVGGWDHVKWTQEVRMAGVPKTSTRYCHSVS